jgi:uncharacterized membrane protein YecN with MAPEG domain
MERSMQPLTPAGIESISLDTLPAITVLFTGILALLYVLLAANVIARRVKHRVTLGDGGHKDLEQAIRVHGNFAEYVPLCLLVIAFVEMAFYASWVVWALGTSLLVGRVLHAIAITSDPGPGVLRLLGMIGTFLVLLAGGALCILAFIDI